MTGQKCIFDFLWLILWEDDESFSETRMTLRNRAEEQAGRHLTLNTQALEPERPGFMTQPYYCPCASQ